MTVVNIARQDVLDVEQVARAPYRRGAKIRVAGPDGVTYLARVDEVTRNALDLDTLDGFGQAEFTVVAAIVSPRRARNQFLVTKVGADGHGAYTEPFRAHR